MRRIPKLRCVLVRPESASIAERYAFSAPSTFFHPSSSGTPVGVRQYALASRLPLTLAIAGGMVRDNGQRFTEDILEVMQEGHQLEDEEGRSLEERVIASSLRILAKDKNKELVQKTFNFFAVFPEDVPIPAALLNVLAPIVTKEKNEKKARLTFGSSLTSLLRHNLIKGSLTTGNGVLMHDIVRDYVINAHSSLELRALHKSVVDVILASRPPDGFPTTRFTAPSTFEGFVARHLFWHLRGALEDGEAVA